MDNSIICFGRIVGDRVVRFKMTGIVSDEIVKWHNGKTEYFSDDLFIYEWRREIGVNS